MTPVIHLPPRTGDAGNIDRYPAFSSRYVIPRTVDVWHPLNNRADSAIRYPVLYLHDGQNLFDPALSFIGVDWGMGEAMTRLMAETGSNGVIMVGLWNTPLRLREYLPQRPFSTLPGQKLRQDLMERIGGESLADNYLRFIVHELKPFIDARYPTLPDVANTFIMGSSMGGLISLYALTEYPAIFSGAAGLSTHWPIGGEMLVDAMGAALPKAGHHRLYFDFGTETLDAEYEPYQRRMDQWLQIAGYTSGQDWLSCKFAGAEHSERAWRVRVSLPLRFLLGLDTARFQPLY